MKKTLNYKDFPVTRETENLKIWKGLTINQKGTINIGKNEEIYESRIYPFKEENDKIKVLSKINKITNQITFVVSSKRITSDIQSANIKIYHNLIKDLETNMENDIIIDKNNFLTGKQIYQQLK